MKDPSRARPSPRVSALRAARVGEAVQVVVAAVVLGLLQVLLIVSVAALVYSGPLAPYAARGIGFALLGSAVVAAVVAIASGLPGTFAGAQSSPGAVLAVLAATVAGTAAPAAGDGAFATTVVAIGLATLATGLFLALLGRFRLGDLVRYLPLPVVGGFLAGTGWLLVMGAVELMAGAAAGGPSLAAYLSPSALLHWAPGLLLGLALLAATERIDHPLVVPTAVVAALALFYAVAWAGGVGPERLGATGWLLGPFPEGGLWRPLAPAELAQVDARAVLGVLPLVLTVLPIAALELLLNVSGLDVATRTDLDPNRELLAVGAANAAAGVLGGQVGFHYLGFTLLARRMRGGRRTVALGAAAVMVASLLLGAAFLAHVPTFLLGGILLYIGAGFVKTWAIDAWSRFPRLEYAVILVILVTIATVGFLEGIAVGWVAAVVLFALAYGRVDVVRHELTGEHARSRVTRTPADRETLAREGASVHVLQLQGFLFFGTGERLLRRARRRFGAAARGAGSSAGGAGGGALRFLVIDFRRVTGLDTTAALGLAKVQRWTERAGGTLLLSAVAPGLRERLAAGGLAPSDGTLYPPDLDRALEWCEERLLREADAPPEGDDAKGLAPWLPEEASWERLRPYLERRALAAGEVLVVESEASDAVYFVASGRLNAQLERAGAEPVRLEAVGPGAVLGELGFFLREPRSASVVASEASVVYGLRREALERMEREEPSLALALHELFVRLLSGRVRHLMGVLRALEG